MNTDCDIVRVENKYPKRCETIVFTHAPVGIFNMVECKKL